MYNKGPLFSWQRLKWVATNIKDFIRGDYVDVSIGVGTAGARSIRMTKQEHRCFDNANHNSNGGVSERQHLLLHATEVHNFRTDLKKSWLSATGMSALLSAGMFSVGVLNYIASVENTELMLTNPGTQTIDRAALEHEIDILYITIEDVKANVKNHQCSSSN